MEERRYQLHGANWTVQTDEKPRQRMKALAAKIVADQGPDGVSLTGLL